MKRKRSKKFLAVLLACVLVVGTAGSMPTVSAYDGMDPEETEEEVELIADSFEDTEITLKSNDVSEEEESGEEEVSEEEPDEEAEPDESETEEEESEEESEENEESETFETEEETSVEEPETEESALMLFAEYADETDAGIKTLADGESTLDILKGTARTVTRLSKDLPAGDYKLVYRTLTGEYYHFTASAALTEIDSDDGIEFDFDYEYDNGHTLGSPSDMFTFTVPEGGATVTIVWDDSEHYDIYEFAVVDASTPYYVNDNTGDLYESDLLYTFDTIETETVYDPLAGATFLFTKVVDNVTYYAVFDENGELTGWTQSKSEATTLTSGEDGYIHLSGLEDGTYYLIETSAPLGYDVLEDPVEVTVSGEGSQAVVNNNPNDYGYQWGEDKHTISGSKTWVDNNNAENTRPETITINLHDATGTQIDSTTVTVGNTTSWSFTVPEVQNEDYSQYYVTENRVRGYESTVNGLNVTNTYTGENLYNGDGELTVTKIWDDEQNQDGKRPENIHITLVGDGGPVVNANGQVVTTVTVTGTGDVWTYTFEDLLEYNEDGTEIKYTIIEEIVSGYDPEINGFTITNSHTPEKIGENGDGTITVTKTWVDDENHDGLRGDEVKFTLTGTVGEETVVTKNLTIEDPGSEPWTGEIEGLYRYSNGEEINYTLVEVDPPEDYTVMITESLDDSGVLVGFNVTNSHDDYMEDIIITKEWDDDGYDELYRPSEVLIHLYANNNLVVNDDVTLSEENDWTAYIPNAVPVFDGETHQEITYSIQEDNVSAGYKVEGGDVTRSVEKDEKGNYIASVTITNVLKTYDNEEPDPTNPNDFQGPIKVSKVWDDGEYEKDHSEDEVTVTVYSSNWEKDGAPVITEEVTLNAEGNWSAEVSGLPKYTSENEQLITYEVSEVSVDGYKSEVEGNGNDGFTVTNTFLVTDWTVEKELINKENATGNDGTYTIGDTAEFMITVTNTGNTTIHQIDVTEVLEGATFVEGDGYTLNAEKTVATVTDLDEGGVVYLYAEYTVEEKDIGTELSNSVTTGVSDGEDGQTPDDGNEPGGKADIPTEEANPHLTVTKEATSTPANGYAYDINEEITYTISVMNDGNQTITDFTVTDELTGGSWAIEKLAPGESQEFNTSYRVTEDDIKNGSVVNTAIVTGGTDPNDDELDPDDGTTPGTDEQPVVEPNPSMYVTKTANVEEGFKASTGDEITYTITVLNNGNETLTNVIVTDEMTGDEWTITELKPGANETFTATYTVTEEDILNGSIANVAVAKSENPNYDPSGSDDPDENPEDVENDGEAIVTTEEADGHLTVTKETTSTGSSRGDYTTGDEITYEITVTNDGNLTITDITVTDELTRDEWTITELVPGDSMTFTASYVVTETDVENGSVVNVATVTGTSPDPEQTDVPSEPGVHEATTYSAFYPFDEEIVPDSDMEDHPESWVDKESVNEYDAIQIEMSTTIPRLSDETLAEGDYTLTFHNQLVSQLVLDELDTDFTVDINGTPIDHKYYEIEVTQDVLPMRILQFFSVVDDCTFHVSIDLSALYNDGVITDDDLGTGTIRVFFFADLETTDVNGSYTSTAWYDVMEDGDVVFTSDQSVVTVYTFEIVVDVMNSDTSDPLEGGTYGLYYDEDCENPVIRNGEEYVVTSDENGQAMFVGIAEGTYYVRELSAPEGYALSEDVQTVTLEGSEDTNHIFEVLFLKALADEENVSDETEDDSDKDDSGKDDSGKDDSDKGDSDIDDSDKDGSDKDNNLTGPISDDSVDSDDAESGDKDEQDMSDDSEKEMSETASEEDLDEEDATGESSDAVVLGVSSSWYAVLILLCGLCLCAAAGVLLLKRVRR